MILGYALEYRSAFARYPMRLKGMAQGLRVILLVDIKQHLVIELTSARRLPQSKPFLCRSMREPDTFDVIPFINSCTQSMY